VIFADKGYKGLPGGLLWRQVHWLISVVEPDDDGSGFDPLPKRWVIERTFGWFGGYRRLIRDYERLPEMSEAGGLEGDDSPDDPPNHLIRQTGSEKFVGAGQKLKRKGASLTYTLSDVEVTVEEDVAWLVHKNSGVAETEAKRQEIDWTESFVLRKEAGGWKVAMLRSTINRRQRPRPGKNRCCGKTTGVRKPLL
jgi:hypothetical protein